MKDKGVYRGAKWMELNLQKGTVVSLGTDGYSSATCHQGRCSKTISQSGGEGHWKDTQQIRCMTRGFRTRSTAEQTLSITKLGVCDRMQHSP